MTSPRKPVIGIIGGTSRFGQWFRHFFEKNGLTCLVAGRKTKLKPVDLAKRCDIVIVSVPIRSTADVIAEIRDVMRPSALLADLTSVKEMPVREMMKRKRGGVLGMHPLFGPLTPSLKAQNVVFCSGRESRWVAYLEKVFTENRGSVRYMTPREHDEMMAAIQGLVHFSNIAFVQTLKRLGVRPFNPFSTPAFRLQSLIAGRVLGANLSVYADIESYNKRFHAVLGKYVRGVGELSELVTHGKDKDLESVFRDIAEHISDFTPLAEAKSTEIAQILDYRVDQGGGSKRRGRVSETGIVCLGPVGTFSYYAATEIASKRRIVMRDSIRQVFDAVANGEIAFGIVPIENSINGIVQESSDALLDYPVCVIGSLSLPIRHALLSTAKDPGRITTIRSHIQPIGQCRRWLDAHFPDAELQPYQSTVAAIESSKSSEVGFVAHRGMARKYDLNILFEDIQDDPGNETEFYVISGSRKPNPFRGLRRDKTALIVTVCDRPGVLRDILDTIYQRGINLTKLHSRKSAVSGWDYSFYLVLDCKVGSRLFRELLPELREHCSIVRVLGSV